MESTGGLRSDEVEKQRSRKINLRETQYEIEKHVGFILFSFTSGLPLLFLLGSLRCVGGGDGREQWCWWWKEK